MPHLNWHLMEIWYLKMPKVGKSGGVNTNGQVRTFTLGQDHNGEHETFQSSQRDRVVVIRASNGYATSWPKTEKNSAAYVNTHNQFILKIRLSELRAYANGHRQVMYGYFSPAQIPENIFVDGSSVSVQFSRGDSA